MCYPDMNEFTDDPEYKDIIVYMSNIIIGIYCSVLITSLGYFILG